MTLCGDAWPSFGAGLSTTLQLLAAIEENDPYTHSPPSSALLKLWARGMNGCSVRTPDIRLTPAEYVPTPCRSCHPVHRQLNEVRVRSECVQRCVVSASTSTNYPCGPMPFSCRALLERSFAYLACVAANPDRATQCVSYLRPRAIRSVRDLCPLVCLPMQWSMLHDSTRCGQKPYPQSSKRVARVCANVYTSCAERLG